MSDNPEGLTEGEAAFRDALHAAINEANDNKVHLSEALTILAATVGAMITSVKGYNERRAGCSIFHCQMVDAIMGVEAQEQGGDCPSSGQTVQ